jgi:hypothetical protein
MGELGRTQKDVVMASVLFQNFLGEIGENDKNPQ